VGPWLHPCIVSENLPFQGEKELQALAMIFAQKEGNDNDFRSKGRHSKFPLPNLVSKFSLAI
jgi:hypothetical protein